MTYEPKSGRMNSGPTSKCAQVLLAGAFVACLGLSGAGLPTEAHAATAGRSGYPGLQEDLSGDEVVSTVSGRFLAARHAEAVGDLVAAAEMTAGFLADLPDSDLYRRRAHLLMLSAGRFADALPLARAVLETNPSDPLANYTLVVRAFNDGAFTDVVALLGVIEESGINAIVVPLLRAWAHAGMGDIDAASAELDALALKNGLGSVAGFHKGLIADLAGDTATAEAAFAQALQATGGHPSVELLDSYARLQVREGRREEAQALVARFIEQNPRTLLVEPVRAVVAGEGAPDRVIDSHRRGVAEVLRNVATLLNRERLRTEALLFMQMSLGVEPGNTRSMFSLAQLLEARDRLDLAVEVYEGIDPASPYSWYARLGIADAMHTRGDTEDAIRLLRRMVSERPDRSDAVRTLADVLRIAKRYDEAISAYDLAFERRGESVDWQLLYSRGIALERAKLWDRAEKDFLAALEIEPDQPLVLNYLGYSWVEQGVQLERAKAMIETAVEKRPRDGFITDSLGWVLYRLGDYEAAVGHLERAVALEPVDPVINDHLGDAYWIVGRRQEARFQWQRSLTLKPDADLAAQLREKLEGRTAPEPLPQGKKRDI
jgi:tetratricopeptide (TPR) repeat protein